MKKLLVLSVLSLLLFSCEKVESGIKRSSELELRQLVKETSVTKESTASFFLVSGRYDSTEREQTTVKVFANVENRYRVIQMNIEDIRIVIDSTVQTPYIVIEYDKPYVISDEELIDMKCYCSKYVIYCQEQYLPERLLPINL